MRSGSGVAGAVGRRRGWLVCAATLLVAGCAAQGAGTSASQVGPSASGPVSSEVEAPPETTPSQGDASAPGPVTLAFAGDVHFESQVRKLLDSPETSLAPLRETLGAADFAMVNLETAITERGSREQKSFTFRAPATALTALASAGVDAVSLANNHGVDFGAVGLEDTLSAKRSGTLPMVGIGADAQEAFAPLIRDIRGVRVAFLASLQLHEETVARWSATDTKGGVATNLDMTRLREATRRAAQDADVVVVFMHWGTEYTTCADEWQRRTAKSLAEDGADLIVGGHAHRVQGAGWQGPTYIAYGLGNFIWWRGEEPHGRTGVLTVTLDPATARDRDRRAAGRSAVSQASWTPMLVGNTGLPRPPKSAADTTRLANVWQTAARCGGLSDRPPSAG